MQHEIEKNENSIRVIIGGDITFSENSGFRRMLTSLAEHDFEVCEMDVSKVERIDSAGLGMFLIAKEQADSAGWKISVVGAQGHVQSMLKLTKLSDLLK